MSFLGLDDPWVIGAYVGCFLSVIFCVVYSIKASKDPEDEGDDSDD